MSYKKLLATNYRLALLVFFGICASIGILPFAVWRFSQGQVITGAIDLSIVVALIGAIWFAWRYERTREACWFVVVLLCAGCLVLATVIGSMVLYWAFTVVAANLLLVGRKYGSLANLSLVAGLLMWPELYADTLEMATFAICAVLVSLYAYLSAHLTAVNRERLEVLATYDELTGAGNRRMMERDLTAVFSRGAHHHQQQAIAILDLDHFKSVNDNYGHQAGDEVLKELVNLVQEAMRGEDRLYRMGGEEFVLLMPRTGHASLAALLERLQAYLRPRLSGPGGPVTVSIGAACMQEDSSCTAWLQRADQALYRAKAAGRNRVCVAPQAAADSLDGADIDHAMTHPDLVRFVGAQ